MSEFVNTVDLIGDDLLIDSIIDRTITEFCDDTITKVGAYAFRYCENLKKVDLPSVVSVGSSSFSGCTMLETVIFRTESTMGIGSAPFSGSLIASGGGYIYVPSSRIESLSDTYGLRDYAAQFRVLEDYTVDGTITGELDETKI